MPTQPTAHHIQQLQSALLDAFDHAALIRLVCYGLAINLEWITPVQDKRDMTTIVAELVAYCAGQEGGLNRLLAAAREQNPSNLKLAVVANEWAELDFALLPLPESHPAFLINTSGGNYIEGNVQAAHDIIGRDKNIAGDEVHGDKVAGNKIVGYTAEQVALIIAEIRHKDQPKRWNGRTPYVGLDAFRQDQANLFFGRDKLITHLLTWINERRFVCVTGPSGSGKSSLIQAGLIPALRAGKISGSEQWLIEMLIPGNQPLESLALAMGRMAKSPSAAAYLRSQGTTDPIALHDEVETLLGHHPDQRAIIVVDQFEELFTQCKDEAIGLAFLALLTSATQKVNGRVIILLVMRSDFVSQCASYSELRKLISGNLVLVGAMEPHELAQAIANPALEVGVEIKPDLVSQAIADMRGEPGALPLMQFALKDLFDTQNKRQDSQIVLTLQEYLERGGIQQSLERHANAQFAKFSPEEQVIARKIFMGLIEIGQGTVDTRRIASFTELLPTGTDTLQTEKVIKALADARLITTDNPESETAVITSIETRKVTLAHEKLIEVWPWLTQLVRENRALIEMQNQITMDAVKWDKTNRDPSYLYTGTRLQSVHDQLVTNQLALSPLARQLIDISNQAEDKRIFRNWSIGAGMFLILAIAIGILFYLNEQLRKTNNDLNVSLAETKQNADIALSRQLAAQSAKELSKNRYELASLLAIESGQVANTPEAFSAIRAIIANPFHSRLFFYGDLNIPLVAWSRDDSKILMSNAEGVVILDPSTGNELSKFALDQKLSGLPIWNHDESKILVTCVDRTIRILDSDSGKEISRFKSDEQFKYARWAANDTRIISSSDNMTYLWDIATGNVLNKFLGRASLDFYSLVPILNHDETKLLTINDYQNFEAKPGILTNHKARVVHIWEIETGKELLTLVGNERDYESARWSQNENKIMTSGLDGIVTLWDATTGKELRRVGTISSGPQFAYWSQDGTKVLTLSNEESQVWDIESNKKLFDFNGGEFGMFSPSGRKIWIQNFPDRFLGNHTIQVRDIMSSTEWVTLESDGNQDIALFNHDENKIVTVSSNSKNGVLRMRLWDFTQGHESIEIDHASWASWSPDASKFATSGYDHRIHVWDATTGMELVVLDRHTGTAFYKWSRKGDKILSCGGETVRMSDAIGGIELMKLPGEWCEWSPDESRILTYGNDGITRIFNSVTGKELLQLDGVDWARWSNDGRKILTEDIAHSVRVLDSDTGKVIFKLDGMTKPTLSDDGNKLLASRIDTKNHVESGIHIWNVNSGKEIFALPYYGKMNQEGNKLLTVNPESNTAQIIDIETGQELFNLRDVHNASWVDLNDSKALIERTNRVPEIWDPFAGKKLFTLDRENLDTGKNSNFTDAIWNRTRTYFFTDQTSVAHRVTLWDSTTAQKILVVDGVRSAEWSKDGRKFLTIGDDGHIRMWFVYMEDLLIAACKWVPRNLNWEEWSIYMSKANKMYRPTCPKSPIPRDVINSIKSQSQELIQQNEIISATQQLEQLNSWLQGNGQFELYGVDVLAFVARAGVTATAEAIPPPNETPQTIAAPTPLIQPSSPLLAPISSLATP